jgi:hypothetical protein
MQALYRLATPEELTFYMQDLYPLQDEIFGIAGVYGDKIYLTGGTALARFHFQHRLSEDLDFFTTTADLKLIVNDLVSRLQSHGFGVEMDRLDVYFARFFVLRGEVKLKVDFVREFNLIGSLTQTVPGIFTNSLEDIGANKISAFEDRAEIKDIIDLYCISQRISLEQLFGLADRKRVPVAYEHLLTINVTGISGRALLTQPVPEEDLTTFVENLKRRTEAEVKKKEQMAAEQIDGLVERLLWDFPRAEREVNQHSLPVLKRRLKQLPLPARNALQKVL